MPQEQKNIVYRLPESQVEVPQPKRLLIVEIAHGHKSKQGDQMSDVLGRLADRTKEHA